MHERIKNQLQTEQSLSLQLVLMQQGRSILGLPSAPLCGLVEPNLKGPSCVKPMIGLIRHLSGGGRWPVCEANPAPVGYEPFKECREGYQPAKRLDDDDDNQRSRDVCRELEGESVCEYGLKEGNEGYGCKIVRNEYEREPHPKPYFYMIKDAEGGAERFHFTLN